MPLTFAKSNQNALAGDMRKTCKGCGHSFLGSVKRAFCANACRVEFHAKASAYKPKYLGIPPGTVGAIGELRVSVDLLAKGHEVFRALSPSCSCDLAILKDGKLLRIEVRTASECTDGRLYYGKDGFKADHWALCLPDRIIYEPPIPGAL